MQILGVDFGLKKIGIALAEDAGLAFPLCVIEYRNEGSALKELARIIEREGAERVVFGVPEGTLDRKVISFAKKIKNACRVIVDFQDETLTTKEAQRLSIEAGIKRSRRHEMEDAYAAAIILQEYLLSGKV